MASATPITVIGTTGQDPEVRDAGGTQVASFSVAVSERRKEGDDWVDGNTTWFRVSAWRDLAQNVAQSVTKGTRVVVIGTISERPWTDKDGNERTSMEITADEVAASLRFATVNVQRVVKNGTQQARGQQRAQQRGGGQQRRQAAPVAQDDWSTPGAYDDETPF